MEGAGVTSRSLIADFRYLIGGQCSLALLVVAAFKRTPLVASEIVRGHLPNAFVPDVEPIQWVEMTEPPASKNLLVKTHIETLNSHLLVEYSLFVPVLRSTKRKKIGPYH